MNFEQTNTAYEFLPGAPRFSAILHTTPSGDPERRMASLNAGDPGLYVGGGTINLQFSREIAEPDKYLSIHQAALVAARAGTLLLSDFDDGAPVLLVFTTLGETDSGQGAPGSGTVFLDIFSVGLEPYGLAENYAMLYLIPPNGGFGFVDDASFLDAVSQSARNVIDTVGRFNAGVQAGRFDMVDGLVPVTDLRSCLFSGGAFRRQSVDRGDVAKAIFAGFGASLAGNETGLTLVEFEDGQGEFSAVRD